MISMGRADSERRSKISKRIDSRLAVGVENTKVRIVRIIGRLNIGGPAIHVLCLNAGLDPERFESLLVTGPENPGEGSMLDYALSRGVQPILIPEIVNEATLKAREAFAFIRLFRLLRRVHPHIVHTHTAKAGFLGRLAARLAGVPVIVHTYHGHVLSEYYSPLRTWVLRRMECLMACLTSSIVAVSKQVKRDLVAYGVAPPEKIVVIPLGLDLEPFRRCKELRGEFRRELGLNEETKLVGIVGRIFPIKNHRLFLEAAARVAAENPTAYFVIVGDGIMRGEMQRHACALDIADRVIFTGWRRDLPSIYADLDLLVISSNNEGTPVAAIEAMAAACPVVATRVGGITDVIVDGKNGCLVPPRDTTALANAILQLLQDRETASRMAEEAALTVHQRFNVARLIADMQNLYLDLCHKHFSQSV